MGVTYTATPATLFTHSLLFLLFTLSTLYSPDFEHSNSITVICL